MLAVVHGVVAIAICLDQVLLSCLRLIFLCDLLMILHFGALSFSFIGSFNLFSMKFSILALLFYSFGFIEHIYLSLLCLFCLSLQFLLFKLLKPLPSLNFVSLLLGCSFGHLRFLDFALIYLFYVPHLIAMCLFLVLYYVMSQIDVGFRLCNLRQEVLKVSVLCLKANL